MRRSTRSILGCLSRHTWRRKIAPGLRHRSEEKPSTIFCAVLAGTIMLGASVACAEYSVETLAQYEFPNLTEGIALDQDANIYVSMILTGEIRKHTPDGTETPLAMIPPSPGGLAVDNEGDVYAALMSSFPPPDTPANPETHGVWQIEADGTAGRFAALPVDTFPNAVAIGESGALFVSDSMLGKVYRISSEGTIEDWIVDPLLLGNPEAPPPLGPVGANGLAFSGPDLFVNNTTMGTIVRISVQPDGSAGTPAVAFTDPLLIGADGLAADDLGNLYVANIAQNTVLRVAPEGTIEILADIDDGLDGPSSLEVGADQEIFFVNSGMLTWAAEGVPMPSLMKVVIPEPSSFVLTVCSLVCFVGHASWRKKRLRV